MNKKEKSLSPIPDAESSYSDEYNKKYNNRVKECLLKMYLQLLAEDEELQKERYIEFANLYNELNREEKEIIKEAYINTKELKNYSKKKRRR